MQAQARLDRSRQDRPRRTRPAARPQPPGRQPSHGHQHAPATRRPARPCSPKATRPTASMRWSAACCGSTSFSPTAAGRSPASSRPASFLGLAPEGVCVYTAEAITEVTLCRYKRKAFDRLIDEVPGFAKRLLTVASHELSAAQNQMLLLGRKAATEKVASFLLMMADQAGQGRRGDRRHPDDAKRHRRLSRPHDRDRVPDLDQAEAGRAHRPADARPHQDPRPRPARRACCRRVGPGSGPATARSSAIWKVPPHSGTAVPSSTAEPHQD